MHDEKNFMCDLCDYAASTKTVLKFHRESKHEGIRHPCNKCDFSGVDKSSLRRHMKRKHEVVSYSCRECGFSSSTRGLMQAHKKLLHEDGQISSQLNGAELGNYSLFYSTDFLPTLTFLYIF